MLYTCIICTPGKPLDVTYRIGSTYLPAALEKLNYFLRDHRTMAVTEYDPREFDLLHSVMARLGRPNGLIDIVCGYRTPEEQSFSSLSRSCHRCRGAQSAYAGPRDRRARSGCANKRAERCGAFHGRGRRRLLSYEPVCSCGCRTGPGVAVRRSSPQHSRQEQGSHSRTYSPSRLIKRAIIIRRPSIADRFSI